jgi:GC-rich sequence DNA-binding factor
MDGGIQRMGGNAWRLPGREGEFLDSLVQTDFVAQRGHLFQMPVLEKIEKDMMLHYKERHQIYTKRRQQDDTDDLSLCVGIVAATEREGPEEVDELGRTIRRADESGTYSGVRRARREERQARRMRRRARQTKPITEEDGFSTDSSLGEGDAEDYETAQQSLQARVNALSTDVKAEDFRDPELGLAVRFAGWRKQYEEEYTNAYGGLAMVQGWEYWARQEMIGWEPSRVSVTNTQNTLALEQIH